MHGNRWIAAPMVVVALIAGCGGALPSASPAEPGPSVARATPEPPLSVAAPASPVASPSASPAASPAAAPVPTPIPTPTLGPLPSGLDPDVLADLEGRRHWGFRTDLAWVLAVREDPSAYDDFGFLALDEEYRAHGDLRDHVMGFQHTVQAYGAAHSREYEDVYLDWSIGKVVSLWTANADAHLAAMLEIAGPDAPIAARNLRWTWDELYAVGRRIREDRAWLAEHEAVLKDVEAVLREDRITLFVSTVNPDVPALMVERYTASLGIPAEMLHVVSDGTGLALLAHGRVKVTVVMADGSAPGPRHDLYPVFESDAVGSCGSGDMGIGVGDDGRLVTRCTEGGWTIVLMGPGRGDRGRVEVGRRRFTVVANETVEVRVRLDPGTRPGG